MYLCKDCFKEINPMIHFIKNIIQTIKQKKEAKRIAKMRKRIERCIEGSDIKYEHLIPIPDDEYDAILQELERRVNEEKADEPEFKTEDWQLPDGTVMPGAPLRNIYAWREVIDSMKRIREAYYIKSRPCGKCGMDNTIFFHFRSSDKSWEELCGRAGYMLICPDCLTIIGFNYYMMN